MAVPPPPPPTSSSTRPGRLAAVATLVALQGLGLLGAGVFLLVETLTAAASDRVSAVVQTLLALLAGAGLLLVGRGLWHSGRWARSPALVVNLIALPVGVALVQGGRWYVGLPLLLWAAAVIGLLFSAPVGAALGDTDGQH